ncbi:MAG: FlgD immunoglobulin-like domain containing protein [candidate division KSB1 bacterium]|nr:FlgD immunoglobulin-like domain containing protein [candidate division KSB1 bacterium]
MRHVLWFALMICVGLFSTAQAQVIADFEAGTDGGFSIGWGEALTSIGYADDPSGESVGVLELNFDGAAGDKGAFAKADIESNGAYSLMMWLWLPSDAPDSLLFKAWAQDQNSWGWNEQVYYAGDIAKETWYPITFDLEAKYVADPANLNHHDYKIKAGIEVAGYSLSGAEADWAGTLYMDNVSLIGVEPDFYAQFDDGTTSGFADNGWGTGFTDVSNQADPSGESDGVLALTFDGSAGQKGDVEGSGLPDPASYDMMVYHIWLPEGTPDELGIKTWAQDNNTWTWKEKLYRANAIPKQVWYPIFFNLEAARAMNPAEFDHYQYTFGRAGLEVHTFDVTGADTAWTGTIYIDNAGMLGMDIGSKWVLADFESPAAELQGFKAMNWGNALTDLSRMDDPTGESDGVMKADWDFSLGQKEAIGMSNVSFGWTETDTGATAMTLDVYIPESMPLGAQVSIFGTNVDWSEAKYMVSDSTLTPGGWYTMTYDIVDFEEQGKIDPKAAITIGTQVYYADASHEWTGSVYFDNLTLLGIEKPEGEVASPTVTASVDTSNESMPPYQTVEINWVDNDLGTESYNVYMSQSPVNSLDAEGVIQLTNDIPHGEEYWQHRPFTSDGGEATYYYAVTANDPEGGETELTESCKVGPVTVTHTSATAKARYVADFASSFSLDGLATEFEPYNEYQLVPENAGGDSSQVAGWDHESTDLMWHTTFVVDDDYLYISANVTDDDLNAEGNEPLYEGTQPWMGDALEFYIGYYDVTTLDDYHGYNTVDAEGTGDWRIAFTAWGTSGTATSIDQSFPGVETTVFQKFTGDGYIIETRIFLDSLALNHELIIKDGTKMPMQINCNDLDPAEGDEGRTLQANWGGSSGHEGWKRPGAWGFLEVIGGPAAVNDANSAPNEFSLHQNYPNPFNPVTTLTYDVAKATDVTIVVYDVLGKKVKTLVQAKQAAGTHSVNWDGTNDAGLRVSSGVYFYQMKTTDYTKTQKMMLLK